MSPEATLIFEIWDEVRDFIPVQKRLDIAESILKSVADFGFEAEDVADIADEDPDLANAFDVVYLDEDPKDPEDEEHE